MVLFLHCPCELTKTDLGPPEMFVKILFLPPILQDPETSHSGELQEARCRAVFRCVLTLKKRLIESALQHAILSIGSSAWDL